MENVIAIPPTDPDDISQNNSEFWVNYRILIFHNVPDICPEWGGVVSVIDNL